MPKDNNNKHTATSSSTLQTPAVSSAGSTVGAAPSSIGQVSNSIQPITGHHFHQQSYLPYQQSYHHQTPMQISNGFSRVNLYNSQDDKSKFDSSFPTTGNCFPTNWHFKEDLKTLHNPAAADDIKLKLESSFPNCNAYFPPNLHITKDEVKLASTKWPLE